MAYNDAANYNRLKSMRGLPIGAIFPWSGAQDTIPFGWIECNGAAIAYTKYPLLYEKIGNVYGGVTGSTFKVPSLNNANVAIMDIFQGHFDWLNSYSNSGQLGATAHKPENDKKSDDPFWNTIGGSDNGNKGSDITQNHLSTIDVVGEQTSKPNVVAKYGDFALSEGTLDQIVIVQERKTTDVHLPAHNHDYAGGDDDGGPSYNRKSALATAYASKFNSDYFCYLSGNSANITRSTNDPPKNGTQMADVGASKTVSTPYRSGGGNIVNDGPIGGGQYAATGFDNGNGDTGGDMLAHSGGNKYFFSSLSNAEKSISDLSGHRHGTLDYTFESKLKVLNPGIVNDVQINTVTIDNTPGQNFCTINMSSASPTLEMLFIIRAF